MARMGERHVNYDEWAAKRSAPPVGVHDWDPITDYCRRCRMRIHDYYLSDKTLRCIAPPLELDSNTPTPSK